MPSSDTQFKKGHSGRPKGAKNKITKAYLKAIAKDFDKYGAQVIARVREEEPAVYWKLIAQLIPKDLDVNHGGDVVVQIVKFSDKAKVGNEDEDKTDDTRSLRAV